MSHFSQEYILLHFDHFAILKNRLIDIPIGETIKLNIHTPQVCLDNFPIRECKSLPQNRKLLPLSALSLVK
jgi:hypothetical protein